MIGLNVLIKQCKCLNYSLEDFISFIILIVVFVIQRHRFGNVTLFLIKGCGDMGYDDGSHIFILRLWRGRVHFLLMRPGRR